jgi:hypothetical protein
VAFQPIRKEDGRRRVRFEFDGERGIIRHRDRDEEHGRDYRIEATKDGFRLEPVQESSPG